MIEINNVTKRFGDFTALENISFQVESGSIYGLVGHNGSGKTTLLQSIAGIYRPERGEISIDSHKVYENELIKQSLFFASDNFYFPPQANIRSAAKFYRGFYPHWDDTIFEKLLAAFELNAKKRINSFSKGMQRQTALILALSACPATLLLDESFDGIDPAKRYLVKQILLEYLTERQPSIVISSHNLGELGDLCDQMGFLDQGKLTLSNSIEAIQGDVRKYRIVFGEAMTEDILTNIPHKAFQQSGRIVSFIAQGDEEEIRANLEQFTPLLVETFGLSLEEIFLYEMEDESYDISSIFA